MGMYYADLGIHVNQVQYLATEELAHFVSTVKIGMLVRDDVNVNEIVEIGSFLWMMKHVLFDGKTAPLDDDRFINKMVIRLEELYDEFGLDNKDTFDDSLFDVVFFHGDIESIVDEFNIAELVDDETFVYVLRHKEVLYDSEFAYDTLLPVLRDRYDWIIR